MKDQGRIYSFGTSGAPLSQYLAWAVYARDRYNPSGLVINVVGNDFDESLRKYKPVPSFLGYVADEDGVLVLQHTKGGKRSMFRKIATHSALARYLFFNVGVSQAIDNFKTVVQGRLNEEKQEFVGNTAADASDVRISDSKSMVLAFFRDLPSYAGLPSRRILFVVDGMRAAIYEPELLPSAEVSYFGQMRRFFINTAGENGYEVIDLHDRFVERYKMDKVRFEFPTDGHWNSVGHEVAAQAVEGSDLFHDLFEHSIESK